MNFGARILAAALAAALLLSSMQVEAASRRLAGGKSIGQQSGNVAQRQASVAPGATATPSQAVKPAVAPVQQPMPGSMTQPRSPWRGILGGVAAGLGLAWLASSMGMGEGVGQIFTVLLVVMLAFMAFNWFSRRRQDPQGEAGAVSYGGAMPSPVVLERVYRPENVGNDASARPWERSQSAALGESSSSGSMIGSALLGNQTWGIPAGFDTTGFLQSAKTNFRTLQQAWDKADIATLRTMMTDGMLVEIQSQLAEREASAVAAGVQTEVAMLEATLLGIEDLPLEYMASVEFSGLIREDPSAGLNPFREVWNMSKPKNGASGWLVAGVQALD